jgi:DnaJ-class molecular chaperone
MSLAKPIISINFDQLMYNLYEILNVPQDAPKDIIKKNYIKLIKKFHPDKTSILEEEIYNHIILASQILLNNDQRKKYDKYLNQMKEGFNDLKQKFKNKDSENKITNPTTNPKKTFIEQMNELNIKHGYNKNIDDLNILEKYKEVSTNRNNENKIILKKKVDKKKLFKVNEPRTDIAEYKGNISELSTYIFGSFYTNIDDLDKLYIEDSILSSYFTSLDKAYETSL